MDNELVKKLADAIQDKGRKSGSGEALFLDRLNLELTIIRILEAHYGQTT
jgi:hypothetical protein